MKWCFTSVSSLLLWAHFTSGADDDYNVVRPDGSFDFGYTNPDSYHFADGTRNNVVRGEFGGRNPKTGGIDSTIYTAGPRGYRPRGKNVFRTYDLSQNGPRPIGSPDDPYYDPYEDPSYSFGFRTATYSRQENANRVGDVTGKYTYRDDVGERHDVEYIAGKNTGFHVRTPFPDSNPRSYGPLYFNGRGKPLPRGRTSIQRGLDGSYKFASSGPDQRRTEVSDATGHVRGSYTYLDPKGVQHSVHYIAGPETGYRVLKTVKGAHLPTVFPFEAPGIIPSDFYGYQPDGEVFDAAASGRPFKPSRKPLKPTSELSNGIDVDNEDYDRLGGDRQDDAASDKNGGFGSFGSKKPSTKPSAPSSFSTTSPRPPSSKPGTLGLDNEDDSGDEEDFGDDLFGGNGVSFSGGGGGKPPSHARPTTARPIGRPTGRPTITTFKPTSEGYDDGSYKPEGDDGSYRPDEVAGAVLGSGGSSTTAKPGTTPSFTGYPSGKPDFGSNFNEGEYIDESDKGLFGSESGRPFGNGGSNANNGVLQIGGQKSCPKCSGTIVTNIGDKSFHVPPGVSVRAHVQSIDLYPFESTSPGDAFKAATTFKREQLNEAVSSSTETVKVSSSTSLPTSSAGTTIKDND